MVWFSSNDHMQMGLFQGLLSEPDSRPKNSEKNIFASKFRNGLNRRIGMNSNGAQTQDDYLIIVFY